MAPASKLASYAAKRDFQKTAEPKGGTGVQRSKKLRFVVQRHDATRLHYDLRLELDGVFKSWAVTKGPSLNPSDKRLAVEVEDHPLGYGDFEGTIPKGQYGGGTVQLFDRGTWAPEGGMMPAEALAKGELKFVLAGERLRGSFVLVRMKADKFGGKRVNWLLIKHRDEAANDADEGGGVLAIDESIASGRAMDAIAAGAAPAPTPFMLAKSRAPAADAIWDSRKGLAREKRKAAGTEPPSERGKGSARSESVAKPKRGAAPKKAGTPAPMPAFIAPQLCESVAKPPTGKGWLHEIKFDGYRTQLSVEGGKATLRTRTGLDWTAKFAALARVAKGLPDAILDGEVVALNGDGTPDFPALQAALSEGKSDRLVFFAFDLLFAEGRDLRAEPLTTRKSELATMIAGLEIPSIRFVEHFDADGAAVFQSARDLGLEGIVSKQTKSPYRSGRSESWTKAKIRAGRAVVLGGWTQSDGAFRSLLGGVFRDGALAYVGRIGTGYSAATVTRLMPSLKAHAVSRSPFSKKGGPPRDRNIRWLDPVLVAEIEFAGWTSEGLVRQASFKGLREDKPAEEVEAREPVAPGKVAAPVVAAPTKTAKPSQAPAEASKGKARKVEVMGVALSHPDKALWPESGDNPPVTKQDLAVYFEAVGAWMMPHLEGRPCSIIRAPDGIDHQTFFQRHAMAGGSKLYDTVKILGDHEPYLVINHIEGLAAVAQSGGLELHPSNCKPGDPMVPGRLVFDLDPGPDVPFSEVVATAKALKARLEALGLNAFCKTTGGKGLHVMTPLAVSKKAVNWEQAKGFAHAVCLVMERDEPKRYLTKMSKVARQGRIFLDYLRNDRISTAVAPLSPRARPHAPVSMPLTWAQVKADLDPLKYTVRTVPELLKRSKAWAGYEAAAGSIEVAMRRLGR